MRNAYQSESKSKVLKVQLVQREAKAGVKKATIEL